MIVYHHSGQVKVQNRSWNLTLSVFWMMKIRRTPRGRSATRSPHHSVCARPAVAHPGEPPSRPHVPVDGRFWRHSLPSGRGDCLGGGQQQCNHGPGRSSRQAAYCSWSPGPWGNVAAGADVTLENPARTSSKISTAPDGSSPAQELDAPLLEQSNWVAYRLRPAWGPKTQNA
jgi:hypothetical protein